jgi:hypothetical protein
MFHGQIGVGVVGHAASEVQTGGHRICRFTKLIMAPVRVHTAAKDQSWMKQASSGWTPLL